jgi:hypothetical protein
VEEAAAEVERLFADEGHWQRTSARCREYFDSTHSTSNVLTRFERLVGELVHQPGARSMREQTSRVFFDHRHLGALGRLLPKSVRTAVEAKKA